MLRRFPVWVLRALTSILLVCVPSALLDAQNYVPSPQELDQLLAPVALYPDALLAQITTACTNPQEILDVDNWLRQNPQLRGTALTDAAQAQGFDPAFIALVNFPQILDMMAQDVDSYAAIGDAFQADPAAVTESVQRLRENAYESGALESSAQQQVTVEPYDGQQIIAIQPANPDVVYVPQYNPALIFGGGYVGPGTAALITFGAAVTLGVVFANTHPWGWGHWGWNWRNRSLLYNRSVWRPGYNHYRPRRPTYRPRRPNYGRLPAVRPPRPNPHRPVGSHPRPRPNRPNTYPRPTARPHQRPNNQARPSPETRPTPHANRPVAQPHQRPNTQIRPRPETRQQTHAQPHGRPNRQEQPHAQPRQQGQQHQRPASKPQQTRQEKQRPQKNGRE